MFGLTFEKLLVVMIVAGLVIGPRRLPLYTAQLAHLVRDLRAFVEASRARAEADLGVSVRPDEWHAELRRHDPRHVVREALAADPATRSRDRVS